MHSALKWILASTLIIIALMNYQRNNSSVIRPVAGRISLGQNQISSLQNFQRHNMGYQYETGEQPGTTAGFVFLPESATNPDTPYELTLDQMVNTQLTLCTIANGRAFPGGKFNPALLKTYYVKVPLGFDAESVGDFYGYDKWLQYWMLVKGTYGFDQIPVGFNAFRPQYMIGQGTAISLCLPTPESNIYRNANGLWYYYVRTNPYDFAGAPLKFDLSAVTALNSDWVSDYGMEYVQGRYFLNNSDVYWTYDHYADLAFSTRSPKEYNMLAVDCPKAQFVVPGVGQQVWPKA